MGGLSLRRFGLALLIGTAGAAQAQDEYSFNDVVGAGFEIKSVVTLTMEATLRINSKATGEAVMVTLQKGKAVGICYMSMQSWVYMDKDSLANATLCEVR